MDHQITLPKMPFRDRLHWRFCFTRSTYSTAKIHSFEASFIFEDNVTFWGLLCHCSDVKYLTRFYHCTPSTTRVFKCFWIWLLFVLLHCDCIPASRKFISHISNTMFTTRLNTKIVHIISFTDFSKKIIILFFRYGDLTYKIFRKILVSQVQVPNK